MATVDFDLDNFDDWFKEETAKTFIKFVVELSKVLDAVEDEINEIKKSCFDESLEDRMIRDVKSSGYDKIDKKVLDLL